MKNLNENQSGACPTFFRGRIAESQRGSPGYCLAGYHLAIHARDLVTGDVPDSVIDELDRALSAHDRDERVWRWLRRTLPRCMALVPTRRRRAFLNGVVEAIEDGRM